MRILIIENDAGLRSELEQALAAEGHEIATADGPDACAAVDREAVDLVLCDVGAPALDGIAVLLHCRERNPHALVIMSGPWGHDDAVLASLRGGAYDYIPKPCRADHVVLVVRNAVAQEELRREVQLLRDRLRTSDEDLSVKRRKAVLERTLIRRALERTGGNRTRAARLLDLSHRALLYKIREYGLHG